MGALVRMLLLLLVTVGLALPMAGGIAADAATRPCPSKPVLKACALETPAGAAALRGTATVDAPCHGKAIAVTSSDLPLPTASAEHGYHIASATWSVWTPPTLARPPRS